jgi:hypothetical protein
VRVARVMDDADQSRRSVRGGRHAHARSDTAVGRRSPGALRWAAGFIALVRTLRLDTSRSSDPQGAQWSTAGSWACGFVFRPSSRGNDAPPSVMNRPVMVRDAWVARVNSRGRYGI